VRSLHLVKHPAHHRAFLTPVKLEGLAVLKHQRHKCFDSLTTRVRRHKHLDKLSFLEFERCQIELLRESTQLEECQIKELIDANFPLNHKRIILHSQLLNHTLRNSKPARNNSSINFVDRAKTCIILCR
jgi:hypothetical protein